MKEYKTQFAQMPDWVKPGEVANYLRLSQSRVYQMLRAGELPNRRIGRKWLIPKAALNPAQLVAQ